MKRQEPSNGATQLQPKHACLRASSEEAQAWQLRELSDAVQRYTTLLTDLSDIIAQYARAASPHVRTTIAVDCFGDGQYSFWPFESDSMRSIFEGFVSRVGLSVDPCTPEPYAFYPEHDSNLSSERIMPNELCFEYRNATVYCRLNLKRRGRGVRTSQEELKDNERKINVKQGELAEQQDELTELVQLEELVQEVELYIASDDY
jgi:hypothetical protein